MNGKLVMPGANDPHMARIAMQEQVKREIEEKLQAIQRDLFVRLVVDLTREPDDEELFKLARFAQRASVQYGKAVGFLKENKPAEQKPMTRIDPDGKQHHTMKAEAGKIVMKQPAGPS